MGTLENTYCKNTDANLRRYKDTGWTYIEKLNDGNDFIVARTELGRELCHTVSKDSNLLNHFKLIEDASPDVCYGIKGIGPCDTGVSIVKDNSGTEGHVGITELDCGMWKGDPLNLNSISVDTSFVFPVGVTTGRFEDANNHEKQYGESKIITMLEHILSLQIHLTGGSYINVNDMLKELGKFDFYPNPSGRKIDE